MSIQPALPKRQIHFTGRERRSSVRVADEQFSIHSTVRSYPRAVSVILQSMMMKKTSPIQTK